MDAVKQRSDAAGCLGCGRPTWSESGYCTRCRNDPPSLPETSAPTEPVPAPPSPVRTHVPYVVPLDPDGCVIDDLDCRGCGYNLRGIGADGTCPECSLPVGHSVHGDLLRFCDPLWLRRLARGVRLVILAILASVAVSVVSVIAQFAVATPAGIGITRMYTAAASVGVSLLGIVGVWFITMRDPGGERRESLLSARRLARWCITAQVAAAPMVISGTPPGGVALTRATAAGGPMVTAVMLTATALTIVALVGHLAVFVRLAQLARRLPRTGLASVTGFVAWGYGATRMLAIGVQILAAIAFRSMTGGNPTASPAFSALMILGCFQLIGLLVFGIWGLVLLFQHHGALSRAARQAASAWGTDDS